MHVFHWQGARNSQRNCGPTVLQRNSGPMNYANTIQQTQTQIATRYIWQDRLQDLIVTRQLDKHIDFHVLG